jgi:hypothetical protein
LSDFFFVFFSKKSNIQPESWKDQVIVRLKRKAKNCFSRTERRCSSVQRACYRRHTGEKIKGINNNEREWHSGAAPLAEKINLT